MDWFILNAHGESSQLLLLILGLPIKHQCLERLEGPSLPARHLGKEAAQGTLGSHDFQGMLGNTFQRISFRGGWRAIAGHGLVWRSFIT